MMWIVTPGKEEKLNTYTYYKRAKGQANSGGHYRRIILFWFFSETNTDQANCLFCVIQRSTSNNVLFNRLLNAIENGLFRIGYLIAIVNPNPIEYYMHGVTIIVSNDQAILVLPINHSPMPVHNDLEEN